MYQNYERNFIRRTSACICETICKNQRETKYKIMHGIREGFFILVFFLIIFI